MRRPFDALQCKVLEKLAEALFYDVEMVITPAQVVENLQTQFALIDRKKISQVRLLVTAVGLLLGGPFFLLDTVKGRVATIRKRLQKTEISFFQDLAAIRSIIYAGYYGHWEGVTEDDNCDNPVHRQIGFTLPKFRDRTAPGEVPLTLVAANELTDADFVNHDACPAEVGIVVIGSGAGGAVAAYNLARRGHDVLIIEAGQHYASQDITHEERRMTARLYKDGAIQTSTDHRFVVFQAQCVGGGTLVNNGIALRVNERGMVHPMAPDILDKWASIGAAVDRAKFDSAYLAVEKHLNIQKISPISGRNNGNHILDGWGAYSASTDNPVLRRSPATWFRKNYGLKDKNGNAAECAYCGYCNTGCAYGRKNGMTRSYLVDARRAGAQIIARVRVKHINWRGRDKAIADSVDVMLGNGCTHRIRVCKGVVVAAGAMSSSRILDASGIAGTGEGLSFNIASQVAALMPRDMRTWDEDQMSTYVDCGDFLIESHFQPPMSTAAMLTGWFGDHAAKMRNYSRLASSGILFPIDRRGRVVGRQFSFKLDPDEDLPLIRRAVGTLARVHLAGGALEVYPGLTNGASITPDTDIDAFLQKNIRSANDIILSSSHPQGGNPMNADRTLGVVDTNCRVHGKANVMVTDASVFASCIRVNPQLTTMATAHYATVDGGVFG